MNTLSKKLTVTLSSLLAATLLIPLAQASVYIGAKGGQLQTDIDLYGVDVDDSISYGAYVGYDNNGVGMELDYLKGSDTDLNFLGTTVDGNIVTQSIGVYSVYRYNIANSSVYGKGKLGISINSSDMSANYNNGFTAEESVETTWAGGLGLGIQPTENFAIEAEYSRLSDEQNLISVGTHVAF